LIAELYDRVGVVLGWVISWEVPAQGATMCLCLYVHVLTVGVRVHVRERICVWLGYYLHAEKKVFVSFY